jgi:hypothetical protein
VGREPLFGFGDLLIEDLEPLLELFYCIHRRCFPSDSIPAAAGHDVIRAVRMARCVSRV